MADQPCLTSPPTKSYWIATRERYAKRSGKEGNWYSKGGGRLSLLNAGRGKRLGGGSGPLPKGSVRTGGSNIGWHSSPVENALDRKKVLQKWGDVELDPDLSPSASVA